MKKTIKICDCCKSETDWLYDFYVPYICGLTLESNNNHKYELCKDCMNHVISVIHETLRAQP